MAVIPIVALDFPSATPALDIVRELGSACRFYKVGSELFTAEGPRFIEELRESGSDVFLDLKFHDIPNTVAGSIRSAAKLGARLVTVHASGGISMLRAAVEAAEVTGGGSCGILAVTVLTSLNGEMLAAATGRFAVDITEEVDRLATIAQSANVYGIVCSGREAGAIRAARGTELKILVPGVRLAGDSAGDQARTVTPGEAAAAGADYIVVGRSVTRAADPGLAMRAVVAALGNSA